MVKPYSMAGSTVRRFESVTKDTGKKVAFELEKGANNVLQRFNVKADTECGVRPVLNYSCKNGLDPAYVEEVAGDFCSKLENGFELLKEILKFGFKK